jgi:DNA repair protein RecO (recombination protein O)
MAGEIILKGIVLGSMPVGEYDRRLSILTCEKGRISAFASGARRPMSSLRAACRLFTYAAFTVYPRRDSYSVVKCENPVYFDELSMDPEKSYYGMYFCELLEYFTRENADEAEQVKLLYTALKALLKAAMPVTLVRRVFELRALANFGEAPNIFECNRCRKKDGETEWIFDIRQGTCFCRECSDKPAGTDRTASYSTVITISETVRYTMHYCITSPYKSLFGFRLAPEAEAGFIATVDGFVKNHVDKPIKSLEMLEFPGFGPV